MRGKYFLFLNVYLNCSARRKDRGFTVWAGSVSLPSSLSHLLLSSQSPHLLLPSAPSLIFHSFRLLPPPLSSSLWHTELKCRRHPALWLASRQTLAEPSSTATRQLELPAHNAPQARRLCPSSFSSSHSPVLCALVFLLSQSSWLAISLADAKKPEF